MRKERFRNMMGEFVPLISTPWCRQCHGVAVKIHADTLSFSTHPKPFQPLPPSPSKVLLTNPQQLPLPPMATKQHNLHSSCISQPLFLNRHNPSATLKTLPKHLRNSYNILQRHKPAVSKPSSLRESSVQWNKVWRRLGVGDEYRVLSYGKLTALILFLLRARMRRLLMNGHLYRSIRIWFLFVQMYIVHTLVLRAEACVMMTAHMSATSRKYILSILLSWLLGLRTETLLEIC